MDQLWNYNKIGFMFHVKHGQVFIGLDHACTDSRFEVCCPFCIKTSCPNMNKQH